MSTPLAGILRRRIAVSGPISVAEFMREALGHPEHGYYQTRDPLGRRGDFITAPEISQVFGELIGLWCAEIWRTTLAPRAARLVELGPGRGTLMADALRAGRMAPGFVEAVSVHLVETSPVLRQMQRRALATAAASWHDTLDDVPSGPALIVANEFLDALPVHQLVLTGACWRERLVGLGDAGEPLRFTLATGASPLEAAIPEQVRAAARPGDVAEICPAAIEHAQAIGHRLAAQGGAALIVDYGHERSAPGDTLQALRAHERHDPLCDAGEADLTAHVDFARVAAAARQAGAAVHGPITQRDLLTRLGIEARTERLARNATAAQARNIRSACHRLIAPDEMGTLFKALSLTPKSAPEPPGFELSQEDAATG